MDKNLPDLLRDLRRCLGWSQQRLAQELGVSQPTIWRIERGLQMPSKSVEKLAEMLLRQNASILAAVARVEAASA